ncbi:MAG TPA: DUF2306 domain-containing protein [Flavisolibacter sp.]|jgi:hypothetical protein|nr:DUF2306 domain-containing protein [Flavisolibacter sp.]
MYRAVRNIGFFLWCAGLAAATYLMFELSVPYVSFERNVDFLATKQNVYHIDYWRYAFYAHVFTSILVLPAGFTQFNKAFFRQGWHRRLGMIYILTVLFIAAPTGLLMGFHANGGLTAKASFVLLSTVWFVTTLLAFITAKRRQFIAHGEWLLYSYALTLSAITFRLLALGFDVFDIRVRPQEVYVTIAWLSWVPNLLVAHLLIKLGYVKRLFKKRGFVEQHAKPKRQKDALSV